MIVNSHRQTGVELINHQNMEISQLSTAFVSVVASPRVTGGFASSFVSARSLPTLRTVTAQRSPSFLRPKQRRTCWVAVVGTPTPPPPGDDDSDEDADKSSEASESDEQKQDEQNELNKQAPDEQTPPTPSASSNSPGSSTSDPGSLFGVGRKNRSDDGSRDSEFDLDLTANSSKNGDPNDTESNELFKVIKSIPPPELVQRFTQSAPPVVQKALRETLVSILGSLPPLAFYTSISSMSANLVQLFHSTLVTGYMFRNAAYRLELTRTLDWAGLKALPSSEDKPEIKGGVVIYKQNDGSTVEVPVDEYISELRDTVSSLRNELQRERKGGNELLSFISTMDKENIEKLTKNAGEEVTEAMKKVVDLVTTTQGIDPKKNSVIEASAPELGQLLFYLMVSGFFLREAEVRLDLQRQIGGGKPPNNLLEGGTGDSTSSDSSSSSESKDSSDPKDSK